MLPITDFTEINKWELNVTFIKTLSEILNLP